MSLFQQDKRASLWDHLALLVKWRRELIIFMTIMALSSVTYSIFAKQWYFADSRVLPPSNNSMGLAGLIPNLDSGLLGAMTGMTGEVKLMASVLDSRLMMDRLINKFNWMEREEFTYREDAYKRYYRIVQWEMDEEGAVYLRVDETDPVIAAETCNFLVDEMKSEYNAITVAQARNQRAFIGKRLDQNRDDLKAAELKMQEFMQETGAIAIEEQLAATVSALASLKGEQVLAEVEFKVLQKTLPENSALVMAARERKLILEQEVEKVTVRADSDTRDALIGLDVAPEISITYFRLFREIELQSTIMEFLLPQFEQAHISESREEADLYILDRAVAPEKKFKPKRAILVLSWMFISFVLFYTIIVFIEWLKHLDAKDPERYAFISSVINGLLPKNFFNLKRDTNLD